MIKTTKLIKTKNEITIKNNYNDDEVKSKHTKKNTKNSYKNWFQWKTVYEWEINAECNLLIQFPSILLDKSSIWILLVVFTDTPPTQPLLKRKGDSQNVLYPHVANLLHMLSCIYLGCSIIIILMYFPSMRVKKRSKTIHSSRLLVLT